jgi:hypothetical protein
VALGPHDVSTRIFRCPRETRISSGVRCCPEVALKWRASQITRALVGPNMALNFLDPQIQLRSFDACISHDHGRSDGIVRLRTKGRGVC